MFGYSRSAIEWEELDSASSSGEKHAFTVFIKMAKKTSPRRSYRTLTSFLPVLLEPNSFAANWRWPESGGSCTQPAATRD
jgi:hypothetical protein